MSETLTHIDTSPEAVERCAKWADGNADIFAVALLSRDSLHCDDASAEKLRERHRLHKEQASVLRALAAANAQLERERDALLAFKAYTHQRMDEAGIPPHPGGEHSAAGCRIGDRFDILVAQRDAATAALAKAEVERDRLVEALKPQLSAATRKSIEDWAEAIHAMIPNRSDRVLASGLRFPLERQDAARAALTPAPEAPKDGE